MSEYLVTALIVLFVLLLFLLAIMLFRAMAFGRVPDPVEPVELPEVDANEIANHLAALLRLQTISDLDRNRINYTPFVQIRQALAQMYPRAHAALTCEQVNEYSLLYTWKGRAAELEPILMMGHLDVVPADPATRSEWTHDPFGGEIVDGMLWGRGALDVKCNVAAAMEAVEALLASGYQPERTLYLAFGHDEEVGGGQGNAAIANLLEQRGVRLSAVLDEGGSLVEGVLPGVTLPVALVGVAEKGYATVELRVEGRPGHSSAPPPHTAIGVLARALARLEAAPFQARSWMAMRMFTQVGAFLPFGMRFLFANRWLFGGLIQKQMARNPQTNAMLRTTTAITVIRGGVKDNVLPAAARALVNFRLLPGERVEQVLEHVRKVVNDEAVLVERDENGCWDPSPVSQSDSPVFLSLSKTIRQVFPDTLVAPYLVMGATDSRYYTHICNDVFRFSPYLMDSKLLNSIHGIDERIGVDTLARMVQFYQVLIKSWTTVVGAAE